MWCRGDMYVNKFLCGVDGVRFAVGNDDEERFVGGVRALEGSLMVVEWVEGGSVGSGDSI